MRENPTRETSEFLSPAWDLERGMGISRGGSRVAQLYTSHTKTRHFYKKMFRFRVGVVQISYLSEQGQSTQNEPKIDVF